MNKKISIMVTLFILFAFVFNKEAFSWTEGTHGNLSEYAAESSVLSRSKGDYLKNLGFDNGIEEYFKWGNDNKKIRKWLAQGAELEDKRISPLPIYGVMRSVNHFHDPLERWPWTGAGLDDSFLFLYYTGQSLLRWAQNSANQANHVGGDWSWQKIRDYYYFALTSMADADRQENFARTFKGLGHQVHLIQDAAQPDHVRNDAHPEDTTGFTKYGIGFEKWAGEKFDKLDALKAFAPNPLFPAVSLNISYNGLVPITQFIDTDQYNGADPNITTTNCSITTSTTCTRDSDCPAGEKCISTIGIAEYTNANFFSDHTIFAADELPIGHRHYFPYPKKSSTNLQYYIDQGLLPKTVVAEDGIEDITFYISKDNVNDGETIDYFVKPIYFADDITGWSDREFYRDERCHKDYASLLIPRAVGYSAGLLDYFFRGEIEEIEVVEQVANQAVTGLTLMLINRTLDEEMKDGDVWVAYQYKAQGETDFTYGLSDPLLSGNVPYQGEVTYPFNFPNDSYIPADATDIQYTFVFKGTLGQENGAVVGKVLNTIMGDFIFLAISDTEYAVWQIEEDGGLTLVPAELRLEDYTQRVNVSNNQSPSVVKPNKNYNYHRYMIQNDDDPDYQYFYHAYGNYFDNAYGVNKFVGLRNSYQPPNWDINENWVVDTDFGYMADTSSYCSSRHPFIVYNGEVIKNLEIRRDNDINRIYYDSIAGGRQGGITIPANRKFAVLTPDLYIGHGDVYDTTPPRKQDYLPVYCGCPNHLGSRCLYDTWEDPELLDRRLKREVSYSDSGYPYYFGSVELGNYGNNYSYTVDYDWEANFFSSCWSHLYNCAQPSYIEKHYDTSLGVYDTLFEGNYYDETSYVYNLHRNGAQLHIMDYDVLVPNVTAGDIAADDTFILVCYEAAPQLERESRKSSPEWVETYSYTDSYYYVGTGGECEYWITTKHIYGRWQRWTTFADEEFGNLRHYQLKYRLNGGEVITVPISDWGDSYRKASYSHIGYTLIDEGGEWNWFQIIYSPIEDTGYISGGIQLENPTTLATEKFLFYSYTLKEGWPAPLTFLKRILGVINVETGERNEYEVDDAFLGSLYSGTFDEEKAAAIGLHKKLVQ